MLTIESRRNVATNDSAGMSRLPGGHCHSKSAGQRPEKLDAGLHGLSQRYPVKDNLLSCNLSEFGE